MKDDYGEKAAAKAAARALITEAARILALAGEVTYDFHAELDSAWAAECEHLRKLCDENEWMQEMLEREP